jgi:APA family basic amino acid/polyamine antiporter
MGRLHPRFGTPVRAIGLQAALACIAVSLATFDAIVSYFIFVTVAFLALTVLGLFRMPRPKGDIFRVPGYPVTPLLFLALLLTILVLLAAGRPLQALLGTVVVALGFPVYRFVSSARTPRPLDETS